MNTIRPALLVSLPSWVIGVCSIDMRAVVVGEPAAVVGVVGTAAAVVGVVELAGTSMEGAGLASVSPGVVGIWIQAISSPSGQPWIAGR